MRSYRQFKFEITIREVLFSILILGIMIGLGFFISNAIHNNTSEHNEKYFKALKVDNDANIFNYAIKTGVGDSLTYGTFTANEPVKQDDIKGEYFYIEKVKEVYTQHTRVVSYKCGKSTCTRTETYWTWDYAGREEFQTKTFTFMNKSYPIETVKFTNTEHLDTVTNGHVRYIYNVIPKKFKGTLYSNLKDNKLNNNELFAEKTIKQVMENKTVEADNGVLIFWIAWILLSLIIVVGFIALDNKYLNGH